MQERVETGHDLAGLEVPQLQQPLLVEPLEQHRRAVRIGTQHPDGAATTPVLQGEVLVLALLVREAHLQRRRSATVVRTGTTTAT